MRQSVLFATCSLAATLLVGSSTARADDDSGGDDEDTAKRAALIDRLLDTNTGDAGVTWSAFAEVCGVDCDYVGFGGCTLVEGAADCEVKIASGETSKVFKTITVREADRQPEKLAAAKATMAEVLRNVGYQPVWLEEHRFETPAQPIGVWNVTFKWDWKKQTLTILDGKKTFKKVKAPKLRKGLGVTSAAIWYSIGGDRSAGNAVLRIHGEGDEGEAGDATVVVPLPGLIEP